MIEDKVWEAIEKQLVKLKEQAYDSEQGLLEETITGRNYHTAVTEGAVHRTRENLNWLPALMKRGGKEDREIVLHTLPMVLALQDQDPASPTFGIWPYLFEEPLSQMENPDWNWAAFLGSILITLLEEFSTDFPTELKSEMEEALIYACESIVRRRIGVDYTNISLMSASVLVLTGELLGEERFIQAGIDNMECQLDFVNQNGGFSEYNSPTYGVIDIEETGRLLRYSHRDEVQKTALALHVLSWRVFAEHYHLSTGQIAPPHARCYEDIQSPVIRTLITIGTQGALILEPEDTWDVNLLWPFMTLSCPAELWDYFCAGEMPRTVREEFYKGYDPIADYEVRVLIEKGMYPLVSYTYLHPDYCLGSFNKQDMWNQRRPLSAYIPLDGNTACFRVRCMHDDMDFSGAVMSNVQREGALSGGISFVTDHGDYHYILTPLDNGTMKAKELSAEFVMTGSTEAVKIEKNSAEDWIFQAGACTIHLRILEAVFGDFPVKTELVADSKTKGVRVVLYRNDTEHGSIDFNAVKKAYLLYWMEITVNGEKPQTYAKVSHEAGQSRITLNDTGDFREDTVVLESPGLYVPPYPGKKKVMKNGGFYYHEKGLFKNIP